MYRLSIQGQKQLFHAAIDQGLHTVKSGGETLSGSTTRFFYTIQGLYKKRPVTASLKTG